jgi:putative oxidoreductase
MGILALLFLQLAGTFLVLLIWPEAAFQEGNPLFLTTEGEFVIKNLVLIAAGLAVGGTVRHGCKKQQQRTTTENPRKLNR